MFKGIFCGFMCSMLLVLVKNVVVVIRFVEIYLVFVFKVLDLLWIKFYIDVGKSFLKGLGIEIKCFWSKV